MVVEPGWREGSCGTEPWWREESCRVVGKARGVRRLCKSGETLTGGMASLAGVTGGGTVRLKGI